MCNSFIGIDVSKEKLDICILRNNKLTTKIYDNNVGGYELLISFIKSKKLSPHICMESTGKYSLGSATHLHEAGYKVSILNPLRIRAYRNTQLLRNKTDKYDAQIIAEFCKLYIPEQWHPATSEFSELKELFRCMQSYQEDKIRYQNKLELVSKDSKMRKLMQKSIKHTENQIKELEEIIDSHIASHCEMQKNCKNLQTIPGIGKKTAIAILAEIPDLRNYKSARKLASHAGLTPMHNQSGSSVKGRAKISKIGSSNLRKALYFPAITAINFNKTMITFSKRLEERGKRKMVIIAAVMRKLIHVIFAILKNGVEFKEI